MNPKITRAKLQVNMFQNHSLTLPDCLAIVNHLTSQLAVSLGRRKITLVHISYIETMSLMECFDRTA